MTEEWHSESRTHDLPEPVDGLIKKKKEPAPLDATAPDAEISQPSEDSAETRASGTPSPDATKEEAAEHVA